MDFAQLGGPARSKKETQEQYEGNSLDDAATHRMLVARGLRENKPTLSDKDLEDALNTVFGRAAEDNGVVVVVQRAGDVVSVTSGSGHWAYTVDGTHVLGVQQQQLPPTRKKRKRVALKKATREECVAFLREHLVEGQADWHWCERPLPPSDTIRYGPIAMHWKQKVNPMTTLVERVKRDCIAHIRFIMEQPMPGQAANGSTGPSSPDAEHADADVPLESLSLPDLTERVATAKTRYIAFLLGHLMPGDGNIGLPEWNDQWAQLESQKLSQLRDRTKRCGAISLVRWHNPEATRHAHMTVLLTAKGEEDREGQCLATHPDDIDGLELRKRLKSHARAQPPPMAMVAAKKARGGTRGGKKATPELKEDGAAGKRSERTAVDAGEIEEKQNTKEEKKQKIEQNRRRDCVGEPLPCGISEPGLVGTSLDVVAENLPPGYRAVAKKTDLPEVFSSLESEVLPPYRYIVATVTEEDWTSGNTLDVGFTSAANSTFKKLLGVAAMKEQGKWTTDVINPVVDKADLKTQHKVEEGKTSTKGDLNTQAVVSVMKKGNVTPKHGHHMGVINALLTGLKIWVLWPPGVGGHDAFLDPSLLKRRQVAELAKSAAAKVIQRALLSLDAAAVEEEVRAALAAAEGEASEGVTTSQLEEAVRKALAVAPAVVGNSEHVAGAAVA